MTQTSAPFLLFVYGTLHPERAPAGIAHAARKLKRIGSATLRGRLIDLGDYPGLLLADGNDSGAGSVRGEIFVVPDLITLAELDGYEDYSPSNPAASLFRRVKVTAHAADGSPTVCWVYVYNR